MKKFSLRKIESHGDTTFIQATKKEPSLTAPFKFKNYNLIATIPQHAEA